MLFLRNDDKPGVIGQLGSVLGKNNINIASMEEKKKNVGGEAITMVSVDNEVTTNVLDEIKKISGVSQAKMIKL